jgi:alpha-2-macroglobulin
VFRGGIRASIDETPAISGGFLVAAFRRPDFRVDATLSGDPAVLGSALRGTVDAKYLFGAALSARPVQWRLAREPVLRVPDAIREHHPESQFAVGYLPRQDGPGFTDAPYEGKTEALDPAGRLNLSLPTTPDRDFAQSYVLEGDVEGPSGQHVANRAALVVHPASIYVVMSRLPTFFDAKTDANVTVAAVDLSGTPVGDTAVTLSLLRERWVSATAEGRSGGAWTRHEIPVAEWNVRTSSAATPLPIGIRDGGSYILRAVARDAAGRRTRTEQRFYALGPGVSSWQSDGNRLDLTPERATWKPGETARILIHSPWPSATALVTVEREGIRSHRSFTVTSMQDAVEVPIIEADVPNVYVSVLLVKGRTADELAADGTDVGQPSYRVGYTELTVDDSSKRLRVDVAADREEYRPRQPVRVSVAVAAPGGTPVRAEVTLWAMDYGLLSLTDYKTPDVLKEIYSPKALQVMTTDSRTRLMSRRPAAAPLGNEDVINTSMSARGRFALDEMVMVQGAPETSFTIRQDFRPLVFWLGSATTDAAGRATTTVTLPDSLTTYRIMAVVGDRASHFGFGDREIRVTRPLTLLPAFPRFLGYGDRAVFGAVVTNSSKDGGQAVVTIQSLAPGTVQFSGVTSQTFDLGPGVSKSVTFDALAAAAGSARVRMTVTLGADTDAFEMPLDVTTPTRVETTAAYGETTGTASETLALPTGVVPGSGGLTVSLASTALVGLGEAARYLDEYPYDCAEQKASRALALLLGSDLGQAFTLSSIKPDAYRAAGAQELSDLYSHQCDAGGFSLWPGRCESVSVYLTAYVLHTMKVAETLKVTLDRAAVDRALDYLESELGEPPSQVEWWPVWGASQAYAVKVLAEFGRTPTRDIDRLVAVAERLPIFALSYLADALAATNDKGPRYQDVVRRLTNALRINSDRAHVEEIDDETLGWLWNSNVRATAVVLDGLSRRKDDPTFVAPLVRWLLAARTNSRWGTTHENAMALEALVAYYRVFESEVPRMTTTVRVGGATVGTAAFNGRSTTAQQVHMSMPALLKALTSTTSSTLSISRTGTGRVYYTARVQSLVPDPPEAVDRGFHVERRYEPYAKTGTGQASTTSFSTGDLVRVTVAVTIRGEGRYLALTDPLPAGFEPIEAWFNTTARDLAREATRTSGDDDWRSWWRGGYFDHVEKHDDHVVAFATSLGSGRHEFSYLVRATTAGTFGVGGARLEAMYAPELEGRSQAQTITVK